MSAAAAFVALDYDAVRSLLPSILLALLLCSCGGRAVPQVVDSHSNQSAQVQVSIQVMPTETGGMMQLHFHMTNLSSEFSWVREDIIQVESVEVLRMDFDGRLDDAEWHLVAVPLGSSTRTCREHFYQGLPLPAGGTVETAMLFHVEPDESTAPMLIRVSYRVPFLGAPDGGPDADLAACRHLEITAPQSLNVLIPDQGRVESAE